MSPNCTRCDAGDHEHCTGASEGGCQCAMRGHRPVVPHHPDANSFADPLPVLDLWQALGYEVGHEFDDALAVKGVPGVWAVLLGEVRHLVRPLVAKSEGQKENGDPLYQRAKRALEQMDYYDEVDVRVNLDDAVYSAAGDRVRGTLRMVLTAEGRVR